MKKTEELQHLKDLMTIVNDPYVKKPVKDRAWLELWKELETPVAKIVNKTVSNFYHHERPSSDLIDDAVFESIFWVITHSKSWSPNRGAAPATWAFRKVAQITMSVVGIENITLDVDGTNDEGALKKQALELRLHEESVAGRTLGTSYAGDFEVEHPFDMLEKLGNQDISLLLEALQELLSRGLITDDAATICAERITGTEYSIIAECFGKTEEATRKIAERTNRQLKKLNVEMPRYADLIKIPMIAAVVESKASKKRKSGVTAPK